MLTGTWCALLGTHGYSICQPSQKFWRTFYHIHILKYFTYVFGNNVNRGNNNICKQGRTTKCRNILLLLRNDVKSWCQYWSSSYVLPWNCPVSFLYNSIFLKLKMFLLCFMRDANSFKELSGNCWQCLKGAIFNNSDQGSTKCTNVQDQRTIPCQKAHGRWQTITSTTKHRVASTLIVIMWWMCSWKYSYQSI